MIQKRTVFVLGAGANVPYGFSTGGGLVDKARGQDPREVMGNAGQQITIQQSAAFRQAIEDNLLPSIDALLEHRPDLVQVGKRMIATLLYREEAAAGPKSFAEDWMSLIFSNMARGAPTVEQFGSNPISFVTFNYDRYLEQRFIRGLVARYRLIPEQAWQNIKQMFTHVYGTLGPLPDQIGPGEQRHPVPLGAPEQQHLYTLGVALPQVEQSIFTVHDAAASRAAFAESLQRFQAAQQVFFLGFGFGEENVSRLEVRRIPGEATIFCTTFDMTRAEIDVSIQPHFTDRQSPVLIQELTTARGTSIKRFLREFIQYLG